MLIPGFYDHVRDWRDDEIEALRVMPSDEQAQLEEKGLEAYLGHVSGLEYRKRLYAGRPANICGIETGYTGPGLKTVLPARAMAKLDFDWCPINGPKIFSTSCAGISMRPASGYRDSPHCRPRGAGAVPAR